MFFDDPVKEQIYCIIKSNISENERIALNERFEDIGVGSISLIKIMVGIEDHYDIEIEEKYIIGEGYGNIGNFIDKMAAHVSVCMNNFNL